MSKNVNDMTIAELVALYNEHAEKPVKTFRDKKTAVAKVKAVLPAAAEKPKKDKRQAGAFNYPKEAEIKAHREGTKRARHIELLNRPEGATVEEVMKDIGWNRRQCVESFHILHNLLGYGLTTDDQGRVRLVK